MVATRPLQLRISVDVQVENTYTSLSHGSVTVPVTADGIDTAVAIGNLDTLLAAAREASPVKAHIAVLAQEAADAPTEAS